MAISMNNHESRIKALESGSNMIVITPDYTKWKAISSGYTVTQTGFVFLSDSESSSYTRYLAVNGIKIIGYRAHSSNSYFSNANAITPVKVGDVVTYSVSNNPLGAVACVGFIPAVTSILKIYYIFRYNIYIKIILRIISKISHFFTKIFKYGGEIRDGY